MADGYFNHFPAIARAFPRVLSDIVRETTEAIMEKAAERVPVDTGKLRDSAEMEISGEGNEITGQVRWTAKNEAGEEYGLFVEVGTVNTPAQPFVVPTVQDEDSEYIGRLTSLERRLPR